MDNNSDNDVKKIEVTVDTDNEEEDEDESYQSNNSELKSRLFKIMIFIVIIMVVFLLILFIISLFTNRKKNYSYEYVEDVMTKAAISYFKDNSSYLPSNDGGIVEVDVANLVAAGKMKDLSSYLSDGSSCSGSVLVEKTSNDYSYRPYLNCGEKYSTIEFGKKVLKDNKVVTSGYGLYHVGNEYVFRGEELNNYVSLNSILWRIVKITSNDEVVLIKNDGMLFLSSWDDRYNESTQINSGINNYGSSRVREFLQKAYENIVDVKNNNTNTENIVLSEDDKKRITSFDLCIGKRSFTSNGSDNQVECSEVLENQKVGLLTLSEYMMASIDPACSSPSNKPCSNYNYLVTNKNEWWLMTANSEDNYSVFYVNRSGVINKDRALIYRGIRPVIHLSKNNVVKSGNGTLKDPYILK